VAAIELEPELVEKLKGVQREVRELFDELRLKGETGDITGKKRLERVPALAKNNFANLTSKSSKLARTQAWRLIDFLEGTEKGQLSTTAREALRPIELNRKMAALRASASWKEAAARLRDALGVQPQDAQPPDVSSENANVIVPTPTDVEASDAAAPEGVHPIRYRWRRPGVIIGTLVSLLVGAAGVIWWAQPARNAHYACLALEDAPAKERAAHFSVDPQPRVPRQPFSRDAREHVYEISDAAGRPVQSIWTTSKFSYAEGTTRAGPGGGRSDFRLRVGGWGDTYLSLLQVPVPTNHLVQKAVVRLRVLGDTGDSRPTTMALRVIGEKWKVGTGPNDRLWWRDCPVSSAVKTHLPRPGPRYSAYDIEITDLYNLWALGGLNPYGIILEPEEIGSWGPGRLHYSNFNTFYSTRAADIANRPQLILTY
jgi:hypothetical protein